MENTLAYYNKATKSFLVPVPEGEGKIILKALTPTVLCQHLFLKGQKNGVNSIDIKVGSFIQVCKAGMAGKPLDYLP